MVDKWWQRNLFPPAASYSREWLGEGLFLSPTHTTYSIPNLNVIDSSLCPEWFLSVHSTSWGSSSLIFNLSCLGNSSVIHFGFERDLTNWEYICSHCGNQGQYLIFQLFEACSWPSIRHTMYNIYISDQWKLPIG